MQRTSIAYVKTQKKTAGCVPGTYPSVHNGLLLTSTGIPSLDSILGGGLPIGSIMLIEEDIYNRFSKIMLKYFLAEGIMCRHGLSVSKEISEGQSLLDTLPKPITKVANKTSFADESAMKIAFRYKSLSTSQQPISNVSKQGHYYDISNHMEQSMVKSCNTTEFVLDELLPLCNKSEDLFRQTLIAIRKQIMDCNSYKVPQEYTEGTKTNVLRIVIPSLASPFWCGNTDDNVHCVARFMHALKALVRNHITACVVTIPTHLFTHQQQKLFCHMADCVVKLNSFAGEKPNPLFKQYHGTFEAKKLPCLNSLTSYVPESLDLAFELRRTKFLIEYLHLPPDFSESASRQGTEEHNFMKSSCVGHTLRSNMDF